MTKDLKYFMREHKEEIVTAVGPQSICDDKGNPIVLEIKVLSNADIQHINDNYRNRAIAMDKKGTPYISMGEVVFKTERDHAKAARHILVDALVYPNLKDPELMKFYNCYDITEMPTLVFPRSDEYAHVSRVVMTALGLTGDVEEDKDMEAAKN